MAFYDWAGASFHVYIAKAGEGVTIRTLDGEERWHIVLVPRNVRNARCTMEWETSIPKGNWLDPGDLSWGVYQA